MIVSASRRTDIPAWYTAWFFSRLRAGYVLVRNPMNPKQVSRILLDRDHVDGFVFWTKNPIPMLDRLGELRGWPYYFQWTLNSYGRDVEPDVPEKSSVLIPAFRELAVRIGPERVCWRYDPILLTEKYTVDWHLRYFQAIAARLEGSTHVCTVSFLDMYAKTRRNTAGLDIREARPEENKHLLLAFRDIAQEHGMTLLTCSEAALSAGTGIGPAQCVNAARLGAIAGVPMKVALDRSQGRMGCACSQSVDIGAYDTCPHGCAYCYANAHPRTAAANARKHDPKNALLRGVLTEDDRVRDRHMPLIRQDQITLF